MKFYYIEQDLPHYLEVEALDNNNWGTAIAANSAASGPDTFIPEHYKSYTKWW